MHFINLALHTHTHTHTHTRSTERIFGMLQRVTALEVAVACSVRLTRRSAVFIPAALSAVTNQRQVEAKICSASAWLMTDSAKHSGSITVSCDCSLHVR